MFIYPCVSILTVAVCIFSGSSDDEVHGNVLVHKSLRVVLTSPWFLVERHQIDICNEVT